MGLLLKKKGRPTRTRSRTRAAAAWFSQSNPSSYPIHLQPWFSSTCTFFWLLHKFAVNTPTIVWTRSEKLNWHVHASSTLWYKQIWIHPLSKRGCLVGEEEGLRLQLGQNPVGVSVTCELAGASFSRFHGPVHGCCRASVLLRPPVLSKRASEIWEKRRPLRADSRCWFADALQLRMATLSPFFSSSYAFWSANTPIGTASVVWYVACSSFVINSF